MSPPQFRRRGAVVATLVVAAVSGLAGLAAVPAAAATPPASAAERVVRDRVGQDTILVPDRFTVNAGVSSRPRIGRSQDTPLEQTWQTTSAGRGQVNLVAGPTAGGAPLCLAPQGNSTRPGTALVLAACDGSPGQAWRPLSRSIFTPYQNQLTGLQMELVGGRLVQNEFPRRGDVDFRDRTQRQTFSIVPKSFGIGGA